MKTPKTNLSSIDVSQLSKKELLEMLDLVERKKELARKRKPPFEPTEAQLPILTSPAKEKYLFCGNGFGKTTLLVNWIDFAAKGYNPVTKEHTPVPAVIYLVVDDPSKIEQKIIPEYRRWHELDEKHLHKDGKPHVARITYDNGSVCYILTHEVNLLKLEGVEMTHLAFDEPPPRHVFLGLYRGGRIKGRPLEVFLAGTPLYQPWLRTDIYEKWLEGELPEVACFTGETDDNPHLDQDYKKRFGALLTEEEKLTRFKGHFADLSGQALAGLWNPKKHLIEPKDLRWEDDNPCVVIMDPHPSKAHVAVLLGVDRDNYLYVLDEYQEKALARNYAKSLIKRGWFSKYRVIDIVYDSLGNSEMTSGEGYRTFGEVINEELKKAGIGKARATSYDEKDHEDFVERIKEVLAVPEEPDNFGRQIPRLRVVSTCKGTINDIRQVQWQRDKKLNENKPKLDTRNTDFLSCVKYGLATNLYFRKSKDRMFVYNRPVYGFKPRSQRRPIPQK